MANSLETGLFKHLPFDDIAGSSCEQRNRESKVILYAGSSERRTAFLKLLEGLQGIAAVVPIGGGEERDIPHVEEIVHDKLSYVPSELKTHPQVFVTIASDTRTEIGIHTDKGNYLRSVGKPASAEVVHRNFERMAKLADERGFGYYRVRSASGIEISGERLVDIGTCEVGLDREGLHDLANGSFEKYINAFIKYYSTPPYTTNGLSPIGVTDISGGISLPVLTKLGVVTSINGVSLKSIKSMEEAEEVYDAAMDGLFTVAVGFSERILNGLHPQANEAKRNWSWLKESACKMLSK